MHIYILPREEAVQLAVVFLLGSQFNFSPSSPDFSYSFSPPPRSLVYINVRAKGSPLKRLDHKIIDK